MSDWAGIRDRYLRDGVDTRLGGLAANLLRIGTLSRRPGYSDVVARLVRESGLFIEWTAKDVPVATLVELAELQRVLARWHHKWPEVWSDDSRRAQVATDAATWSGRVLEISGLARRGA
jgi:hypothetical protein